MRRAGDPRAVLLVFGKFEPATDPFHARLAALAPAESVVFRGPFEHRDLPAILGEIDVLVVPSLWWENAPLTIRESHLSRTPVVATGHGGMAESVREGRDGYLFRAGDPSDLARVMLGLLARHQQNDWPRFDFPERKTIREDASELEFRYRAAMARRRAESPAVLREARGRDFASSEGTVEIQGGALALLRPGGGGARARYAIESKDGGEAELLVELLALGIEPDLPIGGTVEVNGARAGSIALRTATDGRDTVLEWRGPIALRPGPNEIALSNRLDDGREVFLRVRRWAVRRRPVATP